MCVSGVCECCRAVTSAFTVQRVTQQCQKIKLPGHSLTLAHFLMMPDADAREDETALQEVVIRYKLNVTKMEIWSPRMMITWITY